MVVSDGEISVHTSESSNPTIEISSGTRSGEAATDNLDLDRDLPKIAGVQEGLHQYYEIEQTTDLCRK